MFSFKLQSQLFYHKCSARARQSFTLETNSAISISNLLNHEKLNIGRSPADPIKDLIYVLFETGARGQLPDARRHFKASFMTNKVTLPVTISETRLQEGLEAFANAHDGILKGEFIAREDKNRCPLCSYFFICPSKNT